MAHEEPLQPDDHGVEQGAPHSKGRRKRASRNVGNQSDATKRDVSSLLDQGKKPRMNANYFWDSDIVNDDILAYSLEGMPCPPDELNMDEERLSPTGARPMTRAGAKLSGNEYLIRAARFAFTDLAQVVTDLEKKRPGQQRDFMQKQLFQETLRRLMVIAGITPKSSNTKNKYYRAAFSDMRPTLQPESTPPVASKPLQQQAPNAEDDATKKAEPQKSPSDAEKEDLVTGQLRPPSANAVTEDQREDLAEGSPVAEPIAEEPASDEPPLIAEPVRDEASSDEPLVAEPVAPEGEPILAQLADERTTETVAQQTTGQTAPQTPPAESGQTPALRETARAAPVPHFPQSNSGMGPWHRIPPSVPFSEYLEELEGRSEGGTGTGDLLRNYMNLRRKRFGAVFGQKSPASKSAEEAKSSEQAPAEKKDGAPDKAKKAS